MSESGSEFARIALPVVDLLRAPDGPRDRQLLCGEAVEILDQNQGWTHIRATKDGYHGYLPDAALAPAQTNSHWISAPASHAYSAADFKSPDLAALSFGSQVLVSGFEGRFAATDQGYIPRVHLTPMDQQLRDPLSVAMGFLGTPSGRPAGGWLPESKAVWQNGLLLNEAIGLLAYRLFYRGSAGQ